MAGIALVQSLNPKNKSAARCFIVKIILLFIAISFQPFDSARASPCDDIKAQIKHADTYFWFGMAEKGNMESLKLGSMYLDNAERLLTKKSNIEECLHLKKEIDALRIDFINQQEVHFDTLYGVFPLIRLLAPTLFSDALAAGTFELVDDPRVMASTSAGLRLAKEVLQKWSSKPQLNVIFNSIPTNPALEQEVLYIFNSSPKFFVHNFREISRFLTPEQVDEFQKNSTTMPPEITKQLCQSFDTENLLLVTIRAQDQVNSDFFYAVEGHLYNKSQEKPVNSFFNMGFSRDRNRFFKPVILLNLFLPFFAILVYWFHLRRKSRANRISILKSAYSIETLVPLTAYFIGRVTPWAVIPVLSQIAPPPETLAILSFWWPCVTVTLLFIIPIFIYQKSAGYLCNFLGEKFSFDGRGGAISAATAIGTCTYLITPLVLFWEHDALLRIFLLFIAAWPLLFLLGSTLDDADSRLPSSWLWILLPFLNIVFLAFAIPHHASHYLLVAAIIALILAGTRKTLGIKMPQSSIQNIDEDVPENIPEDINEFIKRAKSPSRGFLKFDKVDELINSKIIPSLKAGKKLFLNLTGETGAGKTVTARAIINEFATEFQNTIAVHYGECVEAVNEEVAQVPFKPFREALPDYLMRPLVSPLIPQQQKGLPLDFFSIPFINIQDLFPVSEEKSSEIIDKAKKKQIYKAIADYIQDESERKPVVLFIDNIQWIDSSSRELLSFLLDSFPSESESSLLVLLASRDEINEPDNAVNFQIDPPSKEQCAGILTELLGVQSDSAAILADFFASKDQEVAKMTSVFHFAALLAEKEKLRITDQGFELVQKLIDNPANLPDPENFKAAVESLINDLSNYQINLLEYAACLGDNFKISILAKCLKDENVIDALDEIEEVSGLVYDNFENDDNFSFRDPITLRTVRNLRIITMNGPPKWGVPERIKTKHARIAAVLKETSSGLPDGLNEIARHLYAAGGNHAREAMQSCLAAANLAKTRYNFELARKFIGMAGNCADYLGEYFDKAQENLLIDCERAHVQNKGNIEIADKCIQYFSKNPSATSEKVLKVLARSCYEAVRDIDSFSEDKKKKFDRDRYRKNGLAATEELLKKTTENFGKAEVLFYKSLNEDDLKQNIENLRTCITLLEAIADKENKKVIQLQSWAADMLARQLDRLGPEDAAEVTEFFELSIANKRKLADKPGLSRSLGGLGSFLLKGEKYTAAREYLSESLKYAEDTDDSWGQYLRYWDIGESYFAEASKSSADLSKQSELYKAASEKYKQGLIVSENLGDNQKSGCKFCLTTGLFACSCYLEDWSAFNNYGSELLRFLREGTRYGWLSDRISAALEKGGENSSDWGEDLKELLSS